MSVRKQDGIDSLELHEAPLNPLGRNEVLVKIYSVALNYRDVLIVNGTYPAVYVPSPWFSFHSPNSSTKIVSRIMLYPAPIWLVRSLLYHHPSLNGKSETELHRRSSWITYTASSTRIALKLPLEDLSTASLLNSKHSPNM